LPTAPETSPVPPGYTTFEVAGVVTDIGDRPLAGVVVTHPSDGSVVTTPGLSDANGRFSVSLLVISSLVAKRPQLALYGMTPDYEGTPAFVNIANFAVMDTPIRLRLQPFLDLATGVPFSGVVSPNWPDWGLRRPITCPCARLHVHPVAGEEMHIRVTSPAASPLRVVAEAQNDPNAYYYDDPSPFFTGEGSLVVEGAMATSEVVIPAGFIYNARLTVGLDGATAVGEPVPFDVLAE
jgi:hypothetical protein